MRVIDHPVMSLAGFGQAPPAKAAVMTRELKRHGTGRKVVRIRFSPTWLPFYRRGAMADLSFIGQDIMQSEDMPTQQLTGRAAGSVPQSMVTGLSVPDSLAQAASALVLYLGSHPQPTGKVSQVLAFQEEFNAWGQGGHLKPTKTSASGEDGEYGSDTQHALNIVLANLGQGANAPTPSSVFTGGGGGGLSVTPHGLGVKSGWTTGEKLAAAAAVAAGVGGVIWVRRRRRRAA